MTLTVERFTQIMEAKPRERDRLLDAMTEGEFASCFRMLVCLVPTAGDILAATFSDPVHANAMKEAVFQFQSRHVGSH